MNLPARRVRHLHLRAPTDSAARRLEIALTDALHTASLPGGHDSRIVVLRRLDLGRIAPGLAPATLALRLEHAARDLAPRALPAESPAADTADAVYFADRADLLLRLTRRILAEGPAAARAWYWRAALPAWDAQQSPPSALRQLLDLAHALPEAALVVARLLHLVLSTGNVDLLRAAVPPGQGRRWLRQLGWSWPVSPAINPSTSGTAGGESTADEASVPVPTSAAWETLHDAWDATDDRALWAATLGLVGQNPARASLTDLPSRALRLLHAAQEKHVAEVSVNRTRETSRASPPTSPPRAPSAPRQHQPTTPRDEARTPNSPTTASAEAVAREVVSEERETHPTGGTTRAAGLLFLVPALQRLGWPGATPDSTRSIEEGWGPRLLLEFAARTGTPAEDPLVVALQGLLPDSAKASRELSAVEAAHQRAWRERLRRWFRTTVRLGLRDLVRRDARLHTTSTHLDLSFDLDRSDVRLRRWGLDLDPGWVPWLGRILTFHYD